ncbi:MAG: zinc metallopeptidase [Stappiaceae bacterium]
MPILIAIAGLVIAAIVFGPSYWVKRTMKRHGDVRADFPGTGGELAQHLIDHHKISNVRVEVTDRGDHYDPDDRVVRLSEDNFHKASITAVAVAAHEVGHALQHHRGESGLKLRQFLVRIAMVTDRIASVFFLLAPVLFLLVRAPAAVIGMIGFGIALLVVRVLVHLFTLPVEYDASFNKALPILREGGYLQERDMDGAHSVLKAAAYTYVAGALMSLIDIARWIRILR